jgi:hypothetical protein
VYQIMRNLLVSTSLFLPFFVSAGASAPGSKISTLADGSLSGNVYSNDALELRNEVPRGWIATADPKGQLNLDSRELDGPVNRCSKILLLVHAPEAPEGGFTSAATLFAIDPGCFPDIKFPKSPKDKSVKFPESAKDKQKIVEVADKFVKSFSHTPFISRNGADVDATRAGGRLIIILTGDEVMDAVGGSPATKGPLHVNMLFTLMESNGYWVAWAAVVDDASKELLKNTKMSFKDAR